jgi:Ca2+-binding RTX toxin-like protein
MSELIINPGGTSTTNPNGTVTSGPFFGLDVINEQIVRISQDTPNSPVNAIGSPDDDAILASRANDVTTFQISGGDGDDNLGGALGNDNIRGDAGQDIIQGKRGNDTISGGSEGDILLGGLGDDTIRGDDGLDTANGGFGEDTIDGGQGNDTLLGRPGNDEIFGRAGNDSIQGGDGDDVIDGGANSDNIRGGSGDDVIEGGPGRDVLKGGFGSDTFRFGPGSAEPGNIDRIVDFNPGEDVIELSRRLLPGSGLQSIDDENFEVVRDISSTATSASLIYEQKTGIVYYNPRNGENVPLMELPAGLTDISASDFSIF